MKNEWGYGRTLVALALACAGLIAWLFWYGYFGTYTAAQAERMLETTYGVSVTIEAEEQVPSQAQQEGRRPMSLRSGMRYTVACPTQAITFTAEAGMDGLHRTLTDEYAETLLATIEPTVSAAPGVRFVQEKEQPNRCRLLIDSAADLPALCALCESIVPQLGLQTGDTRAYADRMTVRPWQIMLCHSASEEAQPELFLLLDASCSPETLTKIEDFYMEAVRDGQVRDDTVTTQTLEQTPLHSIHSVTRDGVPLAQAIPGASDTVFYKDELGGYTVDLLAVQEGGIEENGLAAALGAVYPLTWEAPVQGEGKDEMQRTARYTAGGHTCAVTFTYTDYGTEQAPELSIFAVTAEQDGQMVYEQTGDLYGSDRIYEFMPTVEQLATLLGDTVTVDQTVSGGAITFTH